MADPRSDQWWWNCVWRSVLLSVSIPRPGTAASRGERAAFGRESTRSTSDVDVTHYPRYLSLEVRHDDGGPIEDAAWGHDRSDRGRRSRNRGRGGPVPPQTPFLRRAELRRDRSDHPREGGDPSGSARGGDAIAEPEFGAGDVRNLGAPLDPASIVDPIVESVPDAAQRVGPTEGRRRDGDDR